MDPNLDLVWDSRLALAHLDSTLQRKMTLYFENDSLYHPSANLKFDIPNKELNLNRGKRGSDRNPFFNSLHQFNIDVDNIDWYMNSDSIVLGQRGVGFSKTNVSKARKTDN